MPAFWIGVAMIAYDMLGHAACAIASRSATGISLWKLYSRYIWPSISNQFIYDLYWSMWFLIALSLIITGHFIRGNYVPDYIMLHTTAATKGGE